VAAGGAGLGAAHEGRVPEMSPYRGWRVAVFVVTLLVPVLAVAGMITAAAALW
jgi:hypothetical protein